jgi:hypothetical protein
MPAPRILAETPEYQVQNFSPPVKEGRTLREGGKFLPRQYSSQEDLSHTLTPDLYKRAFDLPSEEEGEGIEVERMPVSQYGTGARRYYKKDDDDGEEEGGKGMGFLGWSIDFSEDFWNGVLYFDLAVRVVGTVLYCGLFVKCLWF